MVKKIKFTKPADFEYFIHTNNDLASACDALLDFLKDNASLQKVLPEVQVKKQQILDDIYADIEKEGAYDFSKLMCFAYLVHNIVKDSAVEAYSRHKEASKRSKEGLKLFERLKADGRLTLQHVGYDHNMDWHNFQLLFCGREPKGEPFPIDSKMDGLGAVYYAHKAKNTIYASEKLHSFPVYEIRINTLNKLHTAMIKINNGPWKRINPRLAEMIIDDEAIKVSDSNREAFMTNSNYVDWFRLVFNIDYFEENYHDDDRYYPHTGSR